MTAHYLFTQGQYLPLFCKNFDMHWQEGCARTLAKNFLAIKKIKKIAPTVYTCSKRSFKQHIDLSRTKTNLL